MLLKVHNELLFHLQKIIKITYNVLYYDKRNCTGPV